MYAGIKHLYYAFKKLCSFGYGTSMKDIVHLVQLVDS